MEETCDLLMASEFSGQLYQEDKWSVVLALDPVIKEGTSCHLALEELLRLVANDLICLTELTTKFPSVDPVVYDLSTKSATVHDYADCRNVSVVQSTEPNNETEDAASFEKLFHRNST